MSNLLNFRKLRGDLGLPLRDLNPTESLKIEDYELLNDCVKEFGSAFLYNYLAKYFEFTLTFSIRKNILDLSSDLVLDIIDHEKILGKKIEILDLRIINEDICDISLRVSVSDPYETRELLIFNSLELIKLADKSYFHFFDDAIAVRNEIVIF